MTKLLRKLIPTKPGEGYITFLMFFYIFGVLSIYYILDPIKQALFLKKQDVGQLPFAWFFTAIAAGTISTIAFRLGRRVTPIKLLTATNLVMIATLFYFHGAINQNFWYMPWIYYIYVKAIVSALAAAMFWLFAGYIFDNRQAKRIYPLLGLGAILGATFGSFIPAFLTHKMTFSGMLSLCIGICVFLIALSHVAWRYRRIDAEVKPKPFGHEEPKEKVTDLWKLVFGSRHLFMVSLLVFLTVIATQATEWQINYFAQTAFGKGTDEYTIFFGRFNLITNLLSMSLQVFATGFVINRLGILATTIAMPSSLFLSSIGVFLFPGLYSATIARGSDVVLRYSLNRAGIELLYLPVPPAVRKKLKIFIDVFVDRTGRAVAGVLILALLYVANDHFPVKRVVPAIVLILAVFCAFACRSLAKTYVNSFREQLKRREVDFGDFSNYVTDPSSVRLLVDSLEGNNERQILYSLQLLQSARDIDFSKQLLPLLSHPKPYVRQEATKTLEALPGDYSAESERLLADPSQDVRFASINYLCSHDSTQSPQRLEALLNHANMDVRLDAARWAAEHAGPDFQPRPEFLSQLLALEGPRRPDARAIAASFATRLPRLEAGRLLHGLIEDESPEVASAAALAAGKGGHYDLLFPILDKLTSAKSREAARSALLAYGAHIAGSLGDVLGDARSDIALRREIPWVLGRIPAQWAADRLTDNLGTEEPQLRFRVVEALDRLHESHPEIQISSTAITAGIESETRAYYGGLSVSVAIASDKSGDSQLLSRVLKERRDQNLEFIFRLLELQHEPKEMHSAYDALKGNRADRRTAAIELLDNVLPLNQKSMILPLLEESSAAPLLEFAKKRFGIQVLQRDDALKVLLASPDPWLTTCALHEIGEKHIRNLADACRALVSDANPWIRETAAWALARC